MSEPTLTKSVLISVKDILTRLMQASNQDSVGISPTIIGDIDTAIAELEALGTEEKTEGNEMKNRIEDVLLKIDQTESNKLVSRFDELEKYVLKLVRNDTDLLLKTLPEEIKDCALKCLDLSTKIAEKERRVDELEAEVMSIVANDAELTNDAKRKARRAELIAQNVPLQTLKAELPAMKLELRKTEIEQRFLQDKFTAARTMAESQRR